VFADPLVVQIAKEDVDRKSGLHPQARPPGILDWLVEGCLRYLQRGASKEPEADQRRDREYRQESDKLAPILATECLINRRAG